MRLTRFHRPLAVALLAAVATFGPLQPTFDRPGPLGPPIAAAQAVQPGAETQTSVAGAVTVKATWQGPSDGDGLAFSVVLDTHSVNLDTFDLAQLAVLRTDQGLEVQPIAWAAPPGGHHREGTLTFPGVGPDGSPLIGPGTGVVELVIREVAVPERVLQWVLS